MRRLFLLRGAQGSGKSTWTRENGLAPYTISADEMRLSLSSPVYDIHGNLCIPQSGAKEVWALIKKAIEERMGRGELIILDATNLKTDDMRAYKALANTNRYIVYVVDFTDVPLEVLLERNASRPYPYRVPDGVVEAYHARIATNSVPSGYKVISPAAALSLIAERAPLDLLGYRAVNFYGDVHGCATALENMLAEVGGEGSTSENLRDDEFHVFLGDYIDRGTENAQALSLLMSLASRDNVMMLEGNHERWLDDWAHDRYVASEQFRKKTAPQLEAANISKKDVSRFYRSLIPCAWLSVPGPDGAIDVFANHGGVPCLPDPAMGISCEQLIKGVGGYGDVDEIEATWSTREGIRGIWQVHGHRASRDGSSMPYPGVFCLEGGVEFGGCLRAARFETGCKPYAIEVRNDVFEAVQLDVKLEDVSFDDAVANLRANQMIKEKDLGHSISSFNFTRYAFKSKAWGVQSIKARGLFLDVSAGRVLARSYDKFFNVGEMEGMEIDALASTFSYPVCAYRKENGYLGICSVKDDGELFFASKSTDRGEYASTFKRILKEKLGSRNQEFAQWLSSQGASAVFEVIAPSFDRHIIEYASDDVVLLDVVKNEFAFSCLPYEELVAAAKRFDLPVKSLDSVLEDEGKLLAWYEKVSAPGYVPDGSEQVEGYVLCDAKGRMAKVKCEWYRYWKGMRGVIHDLMKRDRSKRVAELMKGHPETENLYRWMKRYIYAWRKAGNKEDPEVIDVRRAWEHAQEDVDVCEQKC